MAEIEDLEPKAYEREINSVGGLNGKITIDKLSEFTSKDPKIQKYIKEIGDTFLDKSPWLDKYTIFSFIGYVFTLIISCFGIGPPFIFLVFILFILARIIYLNNFNDNAEYRRNKLEYECIQRMKNIKSKLENHILKNEKT